MKYSLRTSPLKFIAYILVSAMVLALVLAAFTDIQVGSWGGILLALLLVQLFQGLLQPGFAFIARKLGMLGILLVSIFGFPFTVWAALSLAPGVSNVSLSGCLVATWIYAIVVTILQWVLLAGSDDYFLHEAVRRARKKPGTSTDTPGFVFVQLDGVSAPVFEWQLNAGNLVNLKQLIDSDEYTFTPWHTQIPSTTPASQAGILLGSHEGIPAFRWYERDSDELIVANKPHDAAIIEKRLSKGRGLLADGGVSVGNIFSGDAAQNIMVMSKLDGDRQSLEAMREYTDYFSSLYGLMRGIVLSVGEVIKELYQAQRQRLRNVQPRVARKLSYVALRAGTNVLLRDLQTTIVVDKMMQGANSIYVDYLDYDEIAHHAGVARPESLAAITGLDGIAGVLIKATRLAPRPYHVVFVSDHGQSQGKTFKQLNNGRSLEDVLGELLDTTSVSSSTAPVEQFSATQSLLAHEASSKGMAGSMAKHLRRTSRSSEVRRESGSDEAVAGAEVVVTGSGNLGNVWLKHFTRRPTRQEIEEAYPGFIDELLKVPGIGMVITSDAEAGPVCVTARGIRHLATGEVEGADPLADYKNIRNQDILALATNTNAPDIQIISSMRPGSREVHAFEELVGNHGGIGGWQTEAILVHPTSLKIAKRFYEENELYDSTTIHKILVDWLKAAGQRRGMHTAD